MTNGVTKLLYDGITLKWTLRHRWVMKV